MANISAEEFARTFEQVTQEQQPTLLQCWSDPPAFTKYIENELMPRIAGVLGFGLKMEHTRIDYILTMPSVSQMKPGQDFKIMAAIEHENNFTGSNREIHQLRTLNAPLGVLITYVSVRQRQRMLNEYLETISSCTTEYSETAASELLVIFGSYGMTPPLNAVWEYFAYRECQFVRMMI